MSKEETPVMNETEQAASQEAASQKNLDAEDVQAVELEASVKEGPKEQQMQEIPLCELKPHPSVESLYERDKKTYDSLLEEMKQNGNKNIPAIQVVANPSGGYSIIEGLTRLKAAEEVNLEALAAQILAPMDETQILLTVVKMQYSRRKGNIKTLIQSVKALIPWATAMATKNQGKRTSRPGEPEDKSQDGSSGLIAGIVLKSASTVKRIRKILDNPELMEKVLAGKLGIRPAYELASSTVASLNEKIGIETNSSEGKSAKGTASLKKLQCKLKELEGVQVWECLEALPQATLEFLKSKFEGYEKKGNGEENENA